MTKRNDTETTYPPAPEASPAAAGPPTSPYSDPKTSSIRLYHVWKGNNKFFLGGRLVFGPDARSLFLTTFLIVAPVTLFCIFVSGRLIQEFQYPIGTIILAVCIVFTAYVICLLFLTSATDPGIIPRNTHPPDSEDDSLGRSSEWPGRHAGIPASLPSTKDVMVNGMYVRVKYCHTCLLYRPPRCSHCSICNNCIERFDHHCPWVGQCIGKRNYRFFFMFVSSTTMLCLYVFAFCCININRIMDTRSCNLWAAVAKSPVTGFLLLYTFIATWFVGGLTSFHLYLIFTNQTTYENFRYHYDSETNPYNRGCVRNAIEVFFSCISSSRVNFREKIEAEESPMESSAFPYSVPFGRTFSPEMANKTSFDLEKGKRGTVGEDDLEGLHSHLDSFGRLERCPTQPHTDS